MIRFVLPDCFRLMGLLAAFFIANGCGYIGPPLPPALQLPNRVTDLTAVQRGSKIVIHFTMSKLTTEAMPVQDPPEADVRVGVSGPRFNAADWLEHSRRLPNQPDRTAYEVPINDFVGKDVVVAVRLLNSRGKDAGWSNYVALPVTAALHRPENLKAQANAQGVELVWSGADAPLFRIYRQGATGDFAPLGDTRQSPYLDATAEYGKLYTYYVQGVQKTGDVSGESEISDSVTLTPKDTFPPGVPANLKAIVGTRSVELSWDRNTESDLAGYHLFRAAAEGPMESLGGKLSGASYSDRSVKPGRYRYSVSAFDLTGNESAPSAVVEAVVP